MSDATTPAGLTERLGMLLGPEGLETVRGLDIAVIGLGGVGGVVVEALVRSGVGRLRLVDPDQVDETNLNRQLQALTTTVGQSKAEVLAARCRAINPGVQLDVRVAQFRETAEEELLSPPPDALVDAIDTVAFKAQLLAACVKRRIPVVSAMGAARRVDPTQVRCVKLTEVQGDPLSRALRKRLRRCHGWTDSEMAAVVAVCSEEVPRPTDGGGGPALPSKAPVGSAMFVPAAYGLAAAWAALRPFIG